MFRVHLPAKSYLRKQSRTFGSAELLDALNPMLRKDAFLQYVGRDGIGQSHDWAPSDAGISDEPNEPDHPPWNHHPETGELLEGGLHPIDFVHQELMDRFRMGRDAAKKVLQEAIERYNKKHPEGSNHTLPDFDSNQWRKVFVGPHYDHREETHMRKVRGKDPLYEGGPRPLITYAFNRGNVQDGSSGSWIDSGFIHCNQEIGEVLSGYGIPEKEIKKLNYVTYNGLKPRALSGGIVQSWTKQQLSTAQRTGMMPEQFQTPEMQQQLSQDRAHGDIRAHQIIPLLHDNWFQIPSAGQGGRTGNVPAYLANKLEEAGIDYNDLGLTPEDLEKIGGTRAMKLLFQETAKLDSASGRGAAKELAHLTFSDIGSHLDFNDELLIHHLEHAQGAADSGNLSFHRRANRAAANFVGHISHAAHKLQEQGLSEDEAKQQVVEGMRNSEVNTKGRWMHEDGVREKAEGLVNLMLGSSGHEQYGLENLSIPTEDIRTGIPEMGMHHEIPKHWHKRAIMGDHEMASVGNSVSHEAPLEAQVMGGRPTSAPAPAPVAPEGDPYPYAQWGPPATPAPAAPAPAAPMPPRQVVPVPGMRQATPIEQAWQQMHDKTRGAQALSEGRLPDEEPQRQTFFDIGSGGLVQRSHDVTSSLDEIRKKMGYFDGFLREWKE